MPNAVTWFEISGKDGKALQEYYSHLFGWEIKADNPMNYGIIDTKGPGINGGVCSTDNQSPSGVTIFVEVADIDATLQAAVDLGGKIVQPVTVVPNMVTFALFEDVEGNVVGLTKSESNA